MNVRFRHMIARIDIRRLSGVGSVVGLEMADGKAYVVELRRKGNPIDLLSGEIVPVVSFACDLPKSTPEETGRILKAALEEHGVKTRYAVMGARQTSIRTVSATIPPDVDNPSEWIADHSQALLKLPVSAPDLCFAVSEGDRKSGGTAVTIMFLRRIERDEYVQLATAAGLKLLALTNGSSHLPRLQRLGGIGKDTQDSSLPGSESIERANVEFTPFGLASDFSGAAGLALHGLIPVSGGAGFLPREVEESTEVYVMQSLFRRTLMVCGSFLLLGLLIPYFASWYLADEADTVDAVLVTSSRSDEDLQQLEREVTLLKESTESGLRSGRRSQTSLYLHEIAHRTPRTVALSALSFDGQDVNETAITLKGYASSQESVSAFLKNLKDSSICEKVSLVKLNARGEAENPQFATTKRGGIRFELKVLLPRAGTL